MTTTHPIRGADHPKQSRTGGTGILPARAADRITRIKFAMLQAELKRKGAAK